MVSMCQRRKKVHNSRVAIGQTLDLRCPPLHDICVFFQQHEPAHHSKPSSSLTTPILMDTLTRNQHYSLEMICPSLFQGSSYVDRSRGHNQHPTAQHSLVSAFTSLVFNISEKLHSITKLYSQMSTKRSDKL